MLEEYDRQMEKLRKQIEPYLVTVPEGTSGEWRVEKFEAVKGIAAMRAWRDGRPVPPGQYTRLSGPRGMFMTDTPAEMNDARSLLWAAEGHVLITGLGIGMIPKMLLSAKAAEDGLVTGLVERITIVELEQDVINLVGPQFAGDPVEIVCADAFDWKPSEGTKFDWAWHDIWPDMCSDYIPEFGKLRRHYQKYMVTAGRQLVWQEAYIKDQERRYG